VGIRICVHQRPKQHCHHWQKQLSEVAKQKIPGSCWLRFVRPPFHVMTSVMWDANKQQSTFLELQLQPQLQLQLLQPQSSQWLKTWP